MTYTSTDDAQAIADQYPPVPDGIIDKLHAATDLGRIEWTDGYMVIGTAVVSDVRVNVTVISIEIAGNSFGLGRSGDGLRTSIIRQLAERRARVHVGFLKALDELCEP